MNTSQHPPTFPIPYILACLLLLTVLSACQASARQPAGMDHLLTELTRLPPLPVRMVGLVESNAPEPTPEWNTYTNANDVTGFVFDAQGRIWSAGRGGVVCWDLQESTYTRFNASHGLPANFITAIATGPDGRIWVGSQDGRLGVYQGQSWEQVAIPLQGTITRLATAPDGTLWVGSNQGLFRLQGQSWQPFTSLDGLPDNYVQSLLVSSQGEVWAGFSGAVAHFDGEQWVTESLPLGTLIRHIAAAPDGSLWFSAEDRLLHWTDQAWEFYSLPGQMPGGQSAAISALLVDAQGNPWFARGASLIHHDGSRWVTQEVPDHLKLVHLVIDSAGTLWGGTLYGGILRLDGQAWEMYQVQAGLISNFVLSLTKAQDGAWWFGTDQGISRLAGGEWHSFTTQDGLVQNTVLALAADPQRGVWAGTEKGVSLFDGEQWINFTDPYAPQTRVRSIALAADGTVWFATPAGPVQYDGAAWVPHTVAAGLQDPDVKQIIQGPDGILWFLTARSLIRFDGTQWLPVQLPNRVLSFTISPTGDVWLGSLHSALFWLDHQVWAELSPLGAEQVSIRVNGYLEYQVQGQKYALPSLDYFKTYSVGQEASGVYIRALTLDKTGVVWIATTDGLIRFDPSSQGWETYATRNGLGAAGVNAIWIEDGAVWAAMPLGGVSRLHP